MKKQTIAFVKDDVSGLRMLDRQYFMQMLSEFGSGTKLKITIENFRPQRTLKQNGAIHWWIDLIAEDCGLETKYMKEILAFKFLKRPALDKDGKEIVDEETGEVQMYIKSTADLDTAEMVKFMDEVWLWTLEHRGFELPQPDENYKINFQEKRKDEISNNK